MNYKEVIDEIIDFPPYNNWTADDFEKYVNLIEFISDNFEQIDLSKEQMRKILGKDPDMIKCLLDTEGLASKWEQQFNRKPLSYNSVAYTHDLITKLLLKKYSISNK